MYAKRSILVFVLCFVSLPALAEGVSPSYVELQDGPTITVNWSTGSTQAVTLHGNRTLVFSNGVKGGKYLLILTQDATGSRTVVLPSSVRWSGETPPVSSPMLTTLANKADYITFFYNGANYDVLGLAQNY